METTPFIVSQAVTLDLIDPAGATTPLNAELLYDPRDPYAVTTVFRTDPEPVRWTFGRELLASGIREPSGDGDVRVWPCLDDDGRSTVAIELFSPDGEALVRAKTGDLRSFVEKMSETVAPGTESRHLDVDGVIAGILHTEGA